MAYTINKTDGSILTVITDGTVDTTTNLVLIGKHTATYGDFLNENLVRLLENAANITPPPSPITGQLWWDKTSLLLKVYDGTAFKTVSASTASATAPATTVVGDLWWDTANEQLKIFNGATYITVGPAYSKNQGITGGIAGTIRDTLGNPHVLVNVMVQNSHVAVISKDTEYTPQNNIAGFGNIKPGFNLASPDTIPGAAYYGTASNASALGNVAAANYARVDVSTTHVAPVYISNSSGLTIGANQNYTQSILGGNTIALTNTINNANIVLQANINSTITNVLVVDGNTGAITVLAEPTVQKSVTTKNYVDSAIAASANSIIDGAPAAYNTLNKIVLETNNSLALKAPMLSPALTGIPTAPTAPFGTNTNQIATTAFVQQAGLTGEIKMWPTAVAPNGYLLCNGQAVSRTAYAALFSIIGTTFGSGDGTTTFNLPNYVNRMPIGAGDLYPVATTGGSKDAIVVAHTHTLTGTTTSNGTSISINGVGDHTHYYERAGSPQAPGSGGSGVSYNNGATTGGGGAHTHSINDPTHAHTLTGTTNSTGSSGANANIPPFLGISFIIKI